MKTRFFVPALMCLTLAACGRGGAPSEVEGKWGTDCTTPFVSFSGDTIHVYPDGVDYKITSAALDGGKFTVSYDSKSGPVTETYILADGKLRLDKGTYGGMQATWHKQPMSKCP